MDFRSCRSTTRSEGVKNLVSSLGETKARMRTNGDCSGESMSITRRQFLQRASGSVAAGLLAGLPEGWVGTAYANGGPEVSQVRFGIIALTDCASIVMAHELGLFKKYGIQSVISKEASWAVIRDKLSL